MTSEGTAVEEPASVHAPVGALRAFCRDVLAAAGADASTAEAAARAMMHGSLLGVDSHGVRLLDHYVRAIEGGRVNGHPDIRVSEAAGAIASLDAGNAHGALATYRAMQHAVDISSRLGIGAVSIRNSSHFGPAGAYALAAAEAGCIGIAMCNSDSYVRLHDGAEPFHGTNPIACAVPASGGRPWLLDMATSAIPYNRIGLYGSLGRRLPEGVASDAQGRDTTDTAEVAMLAPVGGAFGFKGAGLAGLIEIFSAVLSGMKLSYEIAPMAGPDFASPRAMGAFVMALSPMFFPDGADFADRMRAYRDRIRRSEPRAGGRVMAPGDREWAEADRRSARGVPLDPATVEEFTALAGRFALALPFQRS